MSDDQTAAVMEGIMNMATSDYLQGRSKKKLTPASVLNDMRVALEKINSRVRGEKPRKNAEYAPRSRSRAEEDCHPAVCGEVEENGSRMDCLQLMQEIVVVLEDIVSAPSANKKTKGGADYEAADIDASLEGSVASAPPAAEAKLLPPGPEDYPDVTFGGEAPVDEAFDGVADDTAATTGQSGGEAPVDEAFDGSADNPPYSPPAATTSQRYPNVAFGGEAPLEQAFPESAEIPSEPLPPLIVPSAPNLTHEQRMVAGGVQPKPPNRDFAATREMHGGVAPVAPLGLQPEDAPIMRIMPDTLPEKGDFRVIEVPDH